MTEKQAPYKTRPKKWKKETIKGVLQKSGGRCWYCGKEISIESRKFGSSENISINDSYVIDHSVPIIMGGTEDNNNLVPCCWSCNSRKRNYPIEEFRESSIRSKYHIPRFTDEQIDYLLENGWVFPRYPDYEFYFERENLSP